MFGMKKDIYNPNYYVNKIREAIIEARKNGIRVEFIENGLEIENTVSETCIKLTENNCMEIDNNDYISRRIFNGLPVGTGVVAVEKGYYLIEQEGWIEEDEDGNKRINVWDGYFTFDEANIKLIRQIAG